MNTALRATIAIVVLSGAVVLSSGVAAAAQSPVRTDSSSDIDAWVEQRMAARGLPGTAVAVVRGGEVVHLAGYGVADDTGRTVTPDTPFILGSASKPFTGVVMASSSRKGCCRGTSPSGRICLTSSMNPRMASRRPPSSSCSPTPPDSA
jgi:CubicO group peptidase (beta-lactamase class C family)